MKVISASGSAVVDDVQAAERMRRREAERERKVRIARGF
jgi:hypothetical protein